MKRLFLMLFIVLFYVTAFSQITTVDPANNLNSALAKDSVWNGAYTNLVIRNSPSISIFIYSDSASATNGFKVYFSNNGVTARDSVYYTIGKDSAASILLFPRAQYYKIKYTNGSKATHTTVIQPMLFVGAVVYPTLNSKSLITVTPSGNYFAVQDSWEWARYHWSKTDTITALDSVKLTNISTWYRVTIYATDSCMVSNDSTFTYGNRNKLVLIPGMTWTSDKLNFAYFPAFYIKPFTGATSTKFTWSVEGF